MLRGRPPPVARGSRGSKESEIQSNRLNRACAASDDPSHLKVSKLPTQYHVPDLIVLSGSEIWRHS